MKFGTFKSVTLERVEAHYEFVASKMVGHSYTKSPIYPTHLILYESPTHFAYELVGVSLAKTRLRVRKQKLPRIGDLFNLTFAEGESRPAIKVEPAKAGSLNGTGELRNIALGHPEAIKKGFSRFPHLQALFANPASVLVFDNLKGEIIEISGQTGNYLLNNVTIFDCCGNWVRGKSIKFLQVASKGATVKQYREVLDKTLSPISRTPSLGLTLIDSGELGLEKVSHLQNVYLNQSLNEVNIGDFLEKNSDFLRAALGAEKVISQPQLHWIDGPSGLAGTTSRPDYLIVDSDGACSLVELKLPLLKRKNLTKGGKRRTRFVDAVQEGIAQLSRYSQYFSYASNRQQFLESFGFECILKHQILIIGNDENSNPIEIKDAMRVYRNEDLRIVSFDALAMALN